MGSRLAECAYRYFLEQNAGIANKSISGTPINLQYLGVGDGLTVCTLYTYGG